MAPWIAVLSVAAALGLAACGGDGSSTGSTGSTTSAAKSRDAELVSAYCLYSANSKAQMVACEARTKAAQVRSADDEAGRWARGELEGCGKSAGEFCRYYRGGSEGQGP